MGIVFGLIAGLLQAIGYTSLKKSYEELDESIAFGVDALFGLMIWIPFCLILEIDIQSLPFTFVIATISAILAEAYIFYVMGKSNLALAGTVFSTYPIFTVLISSVINKEPLFGAQFIAIIITVTGILTLSIPKELKLNNLKGSLLLLWPLSGAVAVGISDSISKYTINNVDMATFLFSLAIVQIPVAIIFLKIQKQKVVIVKEIISNPRKHVFTLIGSISIVISLIFFWLTFESLPGIIASPLTGTYILWLIIFSALFIKEKVTRIQLFGIVLCLIGVFWISTIG